LEGHLDSEGTEEEIPDIELPELVYKDFIQTKRVSDFEAKLTKITIKVPSYEIVKAGFFSSDYCVYLIESECDGRHKVSRKETDFYMLRKVLRQ
jgi:hypothetical protein